MRRILAIMADQHAGSKLGLMPAGVVLMNEDGNPYVPNQGYTQAEFLWPNYERTVFEVLEWANDDPITLIHDGDICQGDKHGDLVSPLVIDQVVIALANLEPWLALGNIAEVCLIEGTQAHDYTGGTAERLVVDMLSSTVRASYAGHMLLDVGESLLDIAHHGPHPGGRAWLRGNPARFSLRDAMLGEILRGNQVPDLYIRAHYHQPVDETTTIYTYQSRLLIVPSWQAADQFVRKVGQSPPRICCGMAAVEVIDGCISQVRTYVHELDIRTYKTLEEKLD